MRAADPRQRDRCGVTFALPLDASTGRASVIGAFNDWTPGVGAARGTRIRPGNRERSRSGQPEPTALSLSAATPAPPAATPAPRPATARRLVRTRAPRWTRAASRSRRTCGHSSCAPLAAVPAVSTRSVGKARRLGVRPDMVCHDRAPSGLCSIRTDGTRCIRRACSAADRTLSAAVCARSTSSASGPAQSWDTTTSARVLLSRIHAASTAADPASPRHTPRETGRAALSRKHRRTGSQPLKCVGHMVIPGPDRRRQPIRCRVDSPVRITLPRDEPS